MSKLYLEQGKTVLVGYRSTAHISWCLRTCLTCNAVDPIFISTTMSVHYSFIHSNRISNKSHWDPTYNPNHSQTRANVPLNRLPLTRIYGWLPFAAVTTSALCVDDIFMQIWPKFEIIFLNFVDLLQFAIAIAFQELRNAVCRWMN